MCIINSVFLPYSHPRREQQTFHREAVMWRHLTHPSTVPLLGITLEPLQLISTWIPSGELKEYIIGNPDTDRLTLVGVLLLL